MQRTSSHFQRIVCAVLMMGCAGQLVAQVGPSRPSPIASNSAIDWQPDSSVPNASGVASSSESIRPAIDEILLSKAKATAQPAASIPPRQSVVSQDLHVPASTLPVSQPIEQSRLIGSQQESASSAAFDKGYMQTLVSLAGVVLLILGLGQVYKRLARSQGGLAGQLGAGGSAPSGIIEVVGRYPISKGMTLVVLKFDRRILLLSHATSQKGKWGKAASMDVLCELSDPEDVASILLKTRSASGDSIAQSFQRALSEAEDITDEHLHHDDFRNVPMPRSTYAHPMAPPTRTIQTQEGDRAELWSSGQDSRAAAGVLRKRLAGMRRGQEG